MKHLLTICRIFGLCLVLNHLSLGQTLPPDSAFSLNDAGTQLHWRNRLILDAQKDGFMSIKEVLPAPNQKHFVVVACGYECNDNIGFLFRADGSGQLKITAREDYILQTTVEWSSDERQLYYYRINSSGAEASRNAPAEGWMAVNLRTGVKATARTRQLKKTASYEVFNVRNNDVLNVRAQAAAKAQVIGTLPHNAKGLRVSGKSRQANGSTWARIQTKELTGWVNQNYLREERPGN